MNSPNESTIVVLNANCGSKGHTVRASNYSRLLKRQGFHVEEMDVVRADSGPMAGFVRFLYQFALARLPGVWRFLYSSWERVPGMAAVRSSGIAWRFRESRRLLERLQPAAILTTHGYATAIAATLKAQGKLRSYLIAAFGSWHHQPFWCFPEVDHYLVLTERQRQTLIGMGVPASAVTVSGALVAPEYRSITPAVEARAGLGLPLDRPVVLAMGGGQGWRLESIVTAIAELRTPVYAVIFCACERKRDRLERLIALTGAGWAEFRLLLYEPDPAPYFHAADLIVSKPGALTTAQAFASGTPLLAVWPLPGHEEASLRELARAHAVDTAADGEKLSETIDRLLANPADLERTAVEARKLMASDSESIVGELLRSACGAISHR